MSAQRSVRTNHAGDPPAAEATMPGDGGHRLAIGVDAGGTGIKALLVDEACRVLHEHRMPTPRPGPAVAERVSDAVRACVEQLALTTPQPPSALGLAVPGMVDDDTGVAVYSENLGWHDAPLRDMVAERTRLPTVFGHDVRTGGWPRRGSGPRGTTRRRCSSRWGRASRLPCTSTDGRTRGTATRVRSGIPTSNTARSAPTAPSAAWSASVLAPDAVIVGGGLAEAGDELLRPLAERLDARLTFQPRPRLLRAALGDRAAALSALLAHDILAHRSAR